MHIKKTNDLNGNEILAKSVIGNTEIVLISKGTVLKKDYIPKLLELGIEYVVVEDGQEKDLSEDVNVIAKDVFESTKNSVQNVLEQHIFMQNRQLAELCETAKKVVEKILEEKEILETLIEIRQESTDLYSHSVNVCALSTLVALKLNYVEERVKDVAKGSLLHDVGLRYIPNLYENRDTTELEAAERKEYKKHVIYGYEAIRNEEWLTDISKKIILHHHEKNDGSGYPFKIKSNRTPEEVKIVSVCDSFDRRLSGIGCRRIKTHECIEYLKINRNSLFEQKIADILIGMVALYPTGTKVLTNEGEIGFVLRQNKGFTDRPVLMILEDEKGFPLPVPREVDLLKVLNVFIQKPV